MYCAPWICSPMNSIYAAYLARPPPVGPSSSPYLAAWLCHCFRLPGTSCRGGPVEVDVDVLRALDLVVRTWPPGCATAFVSPARVVGEGPVEVDVGVLRTLDL